MKKILVSIICLCAVSTAVLAEPANKAFPPASSLVAAIHSTINLNAANFKEILKVDPAKVAHTKNAIVCNEKSIDLTRAQWTTANSLAAPVTISYLNLKKAGGYPYVGYVTREYRMTFSMAPAGHYYVSSSFTDSVPQYSATQKFDGEIMSYADAFRLKHQTH